MIIVSRLRVSKPGRACFPRSIWSGQSKVRDGQRDGFGDHDGTTRGAYNQDMHLPCIQFVTISWRMIRARAGNNNKQQQRAFDVNRVWIAQGRRKGAKMKGHRRSIEFPGWMLKTTYVTGSTKLRYHRVLPASPRDCLVLFPPEGHRNERERERGKLISSTMSVIRVKFSVSKPQIYHW